MQGLPIIIDCDPGLDDAINLLMALSSPDELNILGITTVAGNVSLELTSRNARIICEIANRTEIPIFAGCAKPWKRSLITADNVHGKTGLGAVKITLPQHKLEKKNAVDFIVDQLMMADDKSVNLVATGPLTNIASAIRKNPQIVGKIGEITIMGGAMREAGNITPSAEYNIFADPHSADLVFKSDVKKNVLGLDVTHQALGTPELLRRLRTINTKAGDTAVELIESLVRYESERYSAEGPPLHDACTIAFVLKRELFQYKHCTLEVETHSELTLGHTSVDFWGVNSKPPNVNWVYSVDTEGFYDLLIDRIRRYK